MKIQSPSWDDSREVWAAFRQACERHLEEMRGVLPDHVLELAHLQGVDDGLIVEVHHDQAERVLRITLRCGDLQMGYYDLILTYGDAQITPEDEFLLARLARSTIDQSDHDADLYRHEVDVTAEGGIEHRLEFHVYRQHDVWIAIRCRMLSWEAVSRPNRDLPVMPDRFPDGPVTETGRLAR